MKSSAIIAIVGRPNVGKSTLFNRLTRQKTSIVSGQPGVTRDRLYGLVPEVAEHESFIVIDTGGFETKEHNFQPFEHNIVWEQTKLAVQEADLVLFMLDAKSGLHPHDHEILQFLRKEKKPILFAVNKIDGQGQEDLVWDFCGLGQDEFIAISAAHNFGMRDLRSKISESLSTSQGVKKLLPTGTKLALIGRPNVGKSSILNRLTGESRSIVSPVAGTTRDSIHSVLRYNEQAYTIIDTAGIRRKTKIDELIEEQSVVRSLASIQQADLVLFVIDAVEGLTDQDTRLINLAIRRHNPVILIVNKWDLVENKDANTQKEFELDLRHQLGDISYIPIHFVSALTNSRVHKIFEVVERVYQQFKNKVATPRLNDQLHRIVEEHPPHLMGVHRRPAKFYYIAQIKSCPPTIVLKCNKADAIKDSYKRYIFNKLKKSLGFKEVPLHLIWRGKADDKKQKAS